MKTFGLIYLLIGLVPSMYLVADFWKEMPRNRYAVPSIILAWCIGWLLWAPMMIGKWLKAVAARSHKR